MADLDYRNTVTQKLREIISRVCLLYPFMNIMVMYCLISVKPCEGKRPYFFNLSLILYKTYNILLENGMGIGEAECQSLLISLLIDDDGFMSLLADVDANIKHAY